MARGVFVLAAAIIVSIGFGPVALGADVQAASTAAQAALSQFEALSKSSEQTGDIPGQTNPAVAPLLDTIFDTAPLADDAARAEDLAPLLAWGDAIGRVGKLYLFAGSGVSDSRSPLSPQAMKRMNHNFVTYGAEIGRWYDAELTITRAEMRAFSPWLASHPEALNDPTRAAGIAQVRHGMAEMISGELLDLQPAATMPLQWRRARMPALLAIAPEAAKFLPAESLRGLRASALSIVASTTDPDMKAQMGQFAALIAAGSPAS